MSGVSGGSGARRKRVLRLLLAALTAVLVVVVAEFVHRVVDMTRGTPVAELRYDPGASGSLPVSDDRFRAVAGAVIATPLVSGHRVDVLRDGRGTFPVLYEDLRRARRSITFQSYYCAPGVLADSVVAILAERARSGVRVLFLADGFGCRRMVERDGDRMRTAGIRVAVLRPVRLVTLHKAQHRSHVRLVIVDGDVAYTGGFGVADKWLTAEGGGWRETNVRVRGPAVLHAQAAFLAAWAEATGELLVSDDLLGSGMTTAGSTSDLSAENPEWEAVPDGGGAIAGIQFATPGLGTTPFERMLFLTIAGARERLFITNPYFVPSASIRALLIAAARRGVDVRILTAGARTDIPSTLFAARSYYDELLSNGVRLFEYVPTIIHAKTIVVDGC